MSEPTCYSRFDNGTVSEKFYLLNFIVNRIIEK